MFVGRIIPLKVCLWIVFPSQECPVQGWTATKVEPLLAETYPSTGRRQLILGGTTLLSNVGAFQETAFAAAAEPPALRVIQDPQTYSALAYEPSSPKPGASSALPPLIVVLHGAGRNDLEIRQDLADPMGEHAGLIPSLIASGQAPSILLDNFAVIAPYSYGRPSFYQDSRSQLLQFIDWAKMSSGVSFDPTRIFLFGFSDGATVAVELMTTRRFAGAVICSYGFTGGSLPARAMERLADLPFWVFHSADDVIFDVANSDRLVKQLRQASATKGNKDFIRYNRYDKDPEQLPARVRGHSMGITASKLSAVYEWMLQLPPVGTP